MKQTNHDPNSGEEYYNRGSHYLDIQEYKKAIADYKKVIELKDTESKLE